MKKTQRLKGFGYDPDDSGHYFMAYVPKDSVADVLVSEHLSGDESWAQDGFQTQVDRSSKNLRVILPRAKWDQVSSQVATEFNKRLKKAGLKTSQWSEGPNLLNKSYGKELVLLCWAIEDVDGRGVSTAIQNWLGLSPEERWWLYTMTNAATGQAIEGRNKGWRKAVRFALTENPISERAAEAQTDLFGFFISAAEDRMLGEIAEGKKKVQNDEQPQPRRERDLSNGI